MPGFVARAGLADRVVALDRVAPEIVDRVQRGRVPITSSQFSKAAR
jgi:hypothetical protein